MPAPAATAMAAAPGVGAHTPASLGSVLEEPRTGVPSKGVLPTRASTGATAGGLQQHDGHLSATSSAPADLGAVHEQPTVAGSTVSSSETVPMEASARGEAVPHVPRHASSSPALFWRRGAGSAPVTAVPLPAGHQAQFAQSHGGQQSGARSVPSEAAAGGAAWGDERASGSSSSGVLGAPGLASAASSGSLGALGAANGVNQPQEKKKGISLGFRFRLWGRGKQAISAGADASTGRQAASVPAAAAVAASPQPAVAAVAEEEAGGGAPDPEEAGLFLRPGGGEEMPGDEGTPGTDVGVGVDEGGGANEAAAGSAAAAGAGVAEIELDQAAGATAPPAADSAGAGGEGAAACSATAPAAAAAADGAATPTDATATDGAVPNEAGTSHPEQAPSELSDQDPDRLPDQEPAASDLDASLRGLSAFTVPLKSDTEMLQGLAARLASMDDTLSSQLLAPDHEKSVTSGQKSVTSVAGAGPRSVELGASSASTAAAIARGAGMAAGVAGRSVARAFGWLGARMAGRGGQGMPAPGRSVAPSAQQQGVGAVGQVAQDQAAVSDAGAAQAPEALQQEELQHPPADPPAEASSDNISEAAAGTAAATAAPQEGGATVGNTVTDAPSDIVSSGADTTTPHAPTTSSSIGAAGPHSSTNSPTAARSTSGAPQVDAAPSTPAPAPKRKPDPILSAAAAPSSSTSHTSSPTPRAADLLARLSSGPLSPSMAVHIQQVLERSSAFGLGSPRQSLTAQPLLPLPAGALRRPGTASQILAHNSTPLAASPMSGNSTAAAPGARPPADHAASLARAASMTQPHPSWAVHAARGGSAGDGSTSSASTGGTDMPQQQMVWGRARAGSMGCPPTALGAAASASSQSAVHSSESEADPLQLTGADSKSVASGSCAVLGSTAAAANPSSLLLHGSGDASHEHASTRHGSIPVGTSSTGLPTVAHQPSFAAGAGAVMLEDVIQRFISGTDTGGSHTAFGAFSGAAFGGGTVFGSTARVDLLRGASSSLGGDSPRGGSVLGDSDADEEELSQLVSEQQVQAETLLRAASVRAAPSAGDHILVAQTLHTAPTEGMI